MRDGMLDLGELIEAALLDVHGLLEPEERAALERSLRAAPPAIQAQIRREQLRYSRLEDLLPAVEPPADLRARVIEAVRRAMAEGRVGVLEPASSRSVPRIWRTTSLAFATAAVVLGVTTVYLRGLFDQLNRDIQERTTVNAPLSPALKDIVVNASYRKVSFEAVEGAPAEALGAQAALHYSVTDGEGFVYCQGLPADETRRFVVVELGEDGTVSEGGVLVPRLANTGADVERLVRVPVREGVRLGIAEVVSATGQLRLLMATPVL